MKAPSVEQILHQAESLEREYDWPTAVELYEKALNLLGEHDLSEKVETLERLARALIRSGFQAKNHDEFKQRLRQAIASCEEAINLCGKVEELKTARISRCKAMIAYVNYWLATEASERTKHLDECWRMQREAMKVYEEIGDRLCLGKVCLELAEYLDDRLDLELDTQAREEILNEALNLGEKAIQVFSKVDEHELARAYCIAGVHCYNAAMSLQRETKRKECEQKVFEYTREAIRISENIGDDVLRSRSAVWLGFAELDMGGGSEKASPMFEDALHHSTHVKDHRVLSEVFDGLAYSVNWSAALEEDPEKMREKSRQCQEYARKAIEHSFLVNYGRGIPHSNSEGLVQNSIDLARMETKTAKRYEMTSKAVTLGKQGLEQALLEGSTHVVLHTLEVLAPAFNYLSTMKTSLEKRQLLEEAMTLAEKHVYYAERLRPHFLYVRAYGHRILSLTLLELSKLEENREKRKELLEKSVSRIETGIALINEHVTSFPLRRELFASLGVTYTQLGDILNQLFQTTDERETLRKLIETYKSAAEMYGKADLSSRVAEANWQEAVASDHLCEYLESAGNFESASKQYERSAHSIRQLNNFYMDYATYMQAWSYIEKAKYSHEREEYSSSKDYYEKAATHLDSSKSWAYLAPNYLSWAHLEQAEDLSRNDQSQESIQSFEKAARLFSQARKSIGAKQNEITSLDEKESAVKLIKASAMREDYCLARVLIEEAKSLYASGDCESSGEKYSLAARRLDKIVQTMETEAEIKELRPMTYMCQAWQKMSVADEMADASLYAEASSLFAKAKESSIKKRTAMIAAGNSAICRALELGANYKSTRNVILYYEAKHYMESASDYYMDAGFGNASTWVSATEALFDAYFYMDKAETEADHKDKTKFYGLVEGYLDRSAKLFNKAGYTKRASDVLRTLERVKEKREFALSLDKVLVAPAVTSSTISMSVPTASHEEAVGLERFEHADIQANLIIRQKDLKVGENLEIHIELVNSGKGSALLTKITEIIPKDFKLTEKPPTYRAEDSYLNLKGKRLDPLKTEEVKLTLRPNAPGVFPLKPVILYLDESGKYKSYQLEPVNITVKATMPEDSKQPKDRLATGHKTLDHLLRGGIPQNYAVILTSPSCDERDLLIKDFLETGVKKCDATFYVTIDPGAAKLAEKLQSNFHLFICNPQADTIAKDTSNVSKLRGVENLTEINIALESEIRKLDPSLKIPKRICIDLVSDILLQHHATQTRRWLTSMIAELESIGFTTLAVIDPRIHSPEELYAILGLFDGEISIFEKETKKGSAKYLKIKKMSNQKYLEDELPLKKEQL